MAGSDDINEIKQRILKTLVFEQEQLAKILSALVIKVEKSARWLPEKAPANINFDSLLHQIQCLEAVIAEEVKATAAKEEAIYGILKMADRIGPPYQPPCPPHPAPLPRLCPCPCQWFQVCKLNGKCIVSAENILGRCQS